MSHEHKAAAPIAWIFGLMAFFVGFATAVASAEDLARISQTPVVHRVAESVKSCFARTAWTDSEKRPDADGV